MVQLNELFSTIFTIPFHSGIPDVVFNVLTRFMVPLLIDSIAKDHPLLIVMWHSTVAVNFKRVFFNRLINCNTGLCVAGGPFVTSDLYTLLVESVIHFFSRFLSTDGQVLT